MPLRFNALLAQAGIALGSVRLLRHQDSQAAKGRTPYEFWRDDRPAFVTYQEGQSIRKRAKLEAPFWASFIVTPAGETMLAGFYACLYVGTNQTEWQWPHADRYDPIGTADIYELVLDHRLSDFDGRPIIAWGGGGRAWIQRADK